MKKSITKALAVFMSLMLVLMSAFPAMAENSSEVEAYLNSTYAKAIDPYGSLKRMMRADILSLFPKQVFLLKRTRHQSFILPLGVQATILMQR